MESKAIKKIRVKLFPNGNDPNEQALKFFLADKMGQILSMFFTAKQFRHLNEILMYLFYLGGIMGNLYIVFMIFNPGNTLGMNMYLLLIIGVGNSFLVFPILKNYMDFNSRRRLISYEDITMIHLKKIRLAIKIATLNFSWYANLIIHFTVIPLIMNRYQNLGNPSPKILNEISQQTAMLIAGDPIITRMLLSLISPFLAFYLAGRLLHLFEKNTVFIRDWGDRYRYRSIFSYHFFLPKSESYVPNITIGYSSTEKEPIIMPAEDRCANTSINGVTGTGKTSSIILPTFRQDAEHVVDYLKDYAFAKELPEKQREHFLRNHINGNTIVETSNELCKDALKILQDLGIPKTFYWYLDPSNPNTDKMNILRGRVSKVASVFATVIEGISNQQDGFFKETQRSHLKQHIYLLKISAHQLGKIPTLTEFVEMYNDPNKAGERIESLDNYYQSVKQNLELRIKQNIDGRYDTTIKELSITERIVKNVRVFFSRTYSLQEVSGQFEKIVAPDGTWSYKKDKDGNRIPLYRWFDSQMEFVMGLKNVLNTMHNSEGLQRVLFSDSDFDLDVHFKYGGFLLINTDKANLGDIDAEAMGKFTTLSIQNAVFRRTPKRDPLHPIVYDEFPDYFVTSFVSFIAQSRKYRTPVTAASQTLAQASGRMHRENPKFMDEMLANLKNKFIFNDTPQFDQDVFEKYMDTKYVWEPRMNVTETDVVSDLLSMRNMESYDRKQVPKFSGEEMSNLEPYTMIARTFINNQFLGAIKVKTVYEGGDVDRIFDIENNPADRKSYELLMQDKANALKYASSSLFSIQDQDEIDPDITSPHIEDISHDEIKGTGAEGRVQGFDSFEGTNDPDSSNSAGNHAKNVFFGHSSEVESEKEKFASKSAKSDVHELRQKANQQVDIDPVKQAQKDVQDADKSFHSEQIDIPVNESEDNFDDLIVYVEDYNDPEDKDDNREEIW